MEQPGPAPNRRWSLRTMFVVVAMVAVWLAYQLAWIKARHVVLSSVAPARELARRQGYAWAINQPLLPPVRAPLFLSLLGEHGVPEVCLVFERDAPDDLMQEKARRVMRLFPESKVKYTLQPNDTGPY